MSLSCPHVARTLPNGLRLAVVPRPSLRRAHLGVFVRVGSRFESRRDNGLSHFLEHMIFRGTDRLRDAHAVNATFERLGASLEACTHVDYAVFELDLPRESFHEAAALLAEVLAEPRFPSIDVERGIVSEELLEDLDDAGRQVNPDNIVRAATYGRHPLGMTITGGKREIERFTVEDLHRHHGRHFGGPSMVVVASGAFEAEAALATLERAFERFPSTPAVAIEAPVPQREPITRHVRDAASQTDVRLSFRAFGERDPRMPALEALMRVVDDGMATRLYRRLCDEGGLCYDTSGSYEVFEDDGVVDFAASVRHDRASAGGILALMEDLAESGPTEDEVALAIRRHRWDVESALDSPASLSHTLGVSWLFGQARSFEEQLGRLDGVTCEGVREVAALLAQGDRLTVATVGLAPLRERKRIDALVRSYRRESMHTQTRR
jgi:predicted Zn-dependent peptidase